MDWAYRALDAWLLLAWSALFFGALALIVKKRRVADDVKAGAPEIRTNLAIFFFDTLLIVPIVAAPAGLLIDLIGIYPGLKSFWNGMPVLLVCVAAVVIGDFVGYWRHRLEHAAFLWPAHAMHHSDRAMNWFSLHRMHPINRFSTVLIDMTALALLGIPPWAVVVNGFVRHYWGLFIHADLAWKLGPLGVLLISPAAHRGHHARDFALSGKNFATVFTVWDRMFGTWRSPQLDHDIETGVEGHEGGFLFEMLHPFKVAGRTVAGELSRSRSRSRRHAA